MERLCSVCGRSYEAQRSTSKYCGGTCRTRATRSGAARPAGEVRELRPSSSRGASDKLETELRAAGRLDTTLGQIALGLATRFDVAVTGADTASALASLARQLEVARASALQGVGDAKSAVSRHRDDLAARRAKRGA